MEKLKICSIGVSSSIHIQRRSLCFSKRGHDVIVISPVNYSIENTKNIFIPQHWGKFRLGVVLYLIKLIRALLKEKPDIIHIHYAGVYEVLASYLSGYPYVVTMMGSDVLERLDGNMNFLKKRVLIFCLKRAAFLTSKSDKITRVSQKYIGRKIEIIKTTWGVDFEKFKKLDKELSRDKFNLDRNTFIVLSTRLMKPLYNIDLIVEAFSLVRQEVPDSHLVLCAYVVDPTYSEKVSRLIDKLQLSEYVTILDKVDNDSMAWLYNAADVSVSIPRSDGLPMSLMEAMACRTPNILGDLDAYDELVCNGISALYVGFTPQEIAGAIVKLSRDETFRNFIVDNAYESIREGHDFDSDVSIVENKFWGISDD